MAHHGSLGDVFARLARLGQRNGNSLLALPDFLTGTRFQRSSFEFMENFLNLTRHEEPQPYVSKDAPISK